MHRAESHGLRVWSSKCGLHNSNIGKSPNLLEMYILRPLFRLAGIRHIKSGAQQSVFQQILQVVLVYTDI